MPTAGIYDFEVIRKHIEDLQKEGQISSEIGIILPEKPPTTPEPAPADIEVPRGHYYG